MGGSGCLLFEGEKVRTTSQTIQVMFAPFLTGPRPVYAGHSVLKPVRTYTRHSFSKPDSENRSGRLGVPDRRICR